MHTFKVGDYVKYTDNYLGVYRPYLRDTQSKIFIITERYHDGIYIGKCPKEFPYFLSKESITLVYQLEFDL